MCFIDNKKHNLSVFHRKYKLLHIKLMFAAEPNKDLIGQTSITTRCIKSRMLLSFHSGLCLPSRIGILNVFCHASEFK